MYYILYITFLDKTKVIVFWLENADVSRTQGVCNVIYIYFFDLPQVRYNIIICICVTDFREGNVLPPYHLSVSSLEKDHSKQG